MLGNRKDPLVDITKKVMEKSENDRRIVETINKDLGIQNRNQLPHEKRAMYDEFVTKQLAEGAEGSTPKTPREKDLAAKKPPFNKITHGDVLKARGVITQEESKEPPFDPDPPRKKRPDEPKTAKGLARSAMRDMIKKAEAKKKKIDEEQVDEAAYSAKAARAGKDIGKPGKMFSKIAKEAGARYGSEERGKKVAGAVLAKIRAKHMKEEEQIEEAKMTRKQKDDAIRRFMSHDPDAGERILAMGKKEKEENKAFASGKKEIKKLQKQNMEENTIEEKHLTAAETSKKEELAKKMKKGDWAKRYGERGKSVMYATATKMAKKLAEEDITIQSVHEEIRTSLLEKANYLNENGTQEQVVEFLNNLTMEQREILNLAEQTPPTSADQATRQAVSTGHNTINKAVDTGLGYLKQFNPFASGDRPVSQRPKSVMPPSKTDMSPQSGQQAGYSQIGGSKPLAMQARDNSSGDESAGLNTSKTPNQIVNQSAGGGRRTSPRADDALRNAPAATTPSSTGTSTPAAPRPAAAPSAAPSAPAKPQLDVSAQKDTAAYKSYWGRHDVQESKSTKSLEKFLREHNDGKKS